MAKTNPNPDQPRTPTNPPLTPTPGQVTEPKPATDTGDNVGGRRPAAIPHP